ncbi:MAG TPA: 16S rRNA (adenine(1518)-N(6)/adenine(1519)-N(6))-dimethyltransferase RsmA [Cyclobacteriaceae bacterium]|nr:16S rRNA (adenine(1518)-N(6)/adenine(1519)-N(6))-dimethyltransferase RsmA [Cyclobacteriaceae bacterium]HRJ82754.1 16S rRNA (adenine(1518)-N(6)/adenine(1519)-N(6))-dimethyltransferase RsmA [Cyclobacteriaceae bacterium]
MAGKSSSSVRPKKSLGQHFLHDKNVAEKIVGALQSTSSQEAVLEVGPGMGVLTRILLETENNNLKVIEIDRDSVAYLKAHYPQLNVMEGDFLEMDLSKIFPTKFSIIGNFPYNISSQILFKVYENKNQVWQVVGMLQKEVADRIAAPHGNKTYGILSVLLQAYYRIDYLFKVPPGVFNPPPKVMSAVVRLERNDRITLPCDEVLFKQVVKQGFNNRRKTLRNALKNLILPAFQDQPEGSLATLLEHEIFNKRAEQLSVEDFIYLTQLIEKSRGGVGSI